MIRKYNSIALAWAWGMTADARHDSRISLTGDARPRFFNRGREEEQVRRARSDDGRL